MDKLRNSLLAKLVALFICLIITMSLFIPDLTLQIIGFGASSLFGVSGGQSCLITNVGSSVLNDEKTGILIMISFSIVGGLAYVLRNIYTQYRRGS